MLMKIYIASTSIWGMVPDQANSGPVPGTPTVITSQGEHAVHLAAAAGGGVGNSKRWTICNPAPGAWSYHCSANLLNGIWRHIANGMFGGVVVHPLSEKPAKEFYMVFGQLFTDNVKFGVNGIPATEPPGEFALDKFLNDQPDVIMTNGMGFKYLPSIGSGPLCKAMKDVLAEKCTLSLNTDPHIGVFKVKPGELTRWYIFNAGPNDGVAFHFIGTYQNDYYGYDPATGHLLRQDLNDQVNWIPPADGQVIETIFPEKGPYHGVDHDMNHVIKGGAFLVNATDAARRDDQPRGTWVPPIDPSNHFPRCVTSDQQGQAVCGATPLVAVANATK